MGGRTAVSQRVVPQRTDRVTFMFKSRCSGPSPASSVVSTSAAPEHSTLYYQPLSLYYQSYRAVRVIAHISALQLCNSSWRLYVSHCQEYTTEYFLSNNLLFAIVDFGTAELYISNVAHGFMPFTGSYILILTKKVYIAC